MASSLVREVAGRLGPDFGVAKHPPNAEPREHLTLDDVRAMIERAPSPRDGALVAMLFYTGARVSEVLEVKVDDLRRDRLRIQRLKKRRVFRLCPSCQHKLSKPYLFCSSCGDQVETPLIEDHGAGEVGWLPFTEPLRPILRRHLRAAGIQEGYIFPGKNAGAHLDRRHVYRIIRECAARIGITSLESHGSRAVWFPSPHRLRDALAIRAVEENDSTDAIRALQEQLGHTDIGTTMRYRKISGKEHREWYDTLWGDEEEPGDGEEAEQSQGA